MTAAVHMSAEQRARWRIRDDQCDVLLSERLPDDSACLLPLPCPRHGPRPTPCPVCGGAGIVDTSPPGVEHTAPWLQTDTDCPACTEEKP